ncbi:MAG: hypothetical protein KJZ86_08395 [Caldilineaceae bacterium]|nr:hypothetical protein [Caldilineaceae bacterium]HRJ40310.1 hypothetical protein [Caldilineaceae bacterium]
MTTAIGKIVKSNTHIDYVCQVYGPGELVAQPLPTDYAFAEFVAIELSGHSSSPGALIGVIYNTLLLNPDFGSLGPRLSPRGEQEIFTPDYLSETATLVGIVALGWREGGVGVYRQGVPGLAADVDAPVRRLSDDELRAFHLDAAGRLSLRYASVLMGMNNPLVPQLLLTLIDRLVTLFPAQSRQLQVMRNNVAWKSIVQPAG